MKRSIVNLIITGCLVLALSSCYPLVQKAYFVESPNVALFDTAGQTNLSFSGQYFTHTNVLASHSFNDHSGMFAGAHIGYQGWTKDNVHDTGLTNSFGLNAGYIFYRNSGRHCFELSAGYGFQTNTNLLRSRKLQSNLYYDQSTDAVFHRLFFQPSYFWSIKGKKLGFTLRNELLYIPHYDYAFETQAYGGSDFTYGIDNYGDVVSFSDKIAAAHQLFFIFKNVNHKIKWGFHAGVSFHSLYLQRLGNNPYLSADVRGNYPTAHPAMATYLVGFDFGLSWKK